MDGRTFWLMVLSWTYVVSVSPGDRLATLDSTLAELGAEKLFPHTYRLELPIDREELERCVRRSLPFDHPVYVGEVARDILIQR